jgi:hypothetical protein
MAQVNDDISSPSTDQRDQVCTFCHLRHGELFFSTIPLYWNDRCYMG